MLVVIVISCIITVLRFGVGVLEDNFVAQLSTHYNSSAQFMSFYGLLNFYLYTMAYVYSPTNKNVHGKRPFEIFIDYINVYFAEFGITKDNPAFSMINDSDEDVIYGSDDESRRPLNRTRNDDDSDWLKSINNNICCIVDETHWLVSSLLCCLFSRWMLRGLVSVGVVNRDVLAVKSMFNNSALLHCLLSRWRPVFNEVKQLNVNIEDVELRVPNIQVLSFLPFDEITIKYFKVLLKFYL